MLELKDRQNNMLQIRGAFLAMDIFFFIPSKSGKEYIRVYSLQEYFLGVKSYQEWRV